jgi:hypothetical protein
VRATASALNYETPAVEWEHSPTARLALGSESVRLAMFGLFGYDPRSRKIRKDRKFLEPRARRLLLEYLSADDLQKRQFYNLIAEAAAACQTGVSDPGLGNEALADLSAETALGVVKERTKARNVRNDRSAERITDAYATVGVASRRAAAIYVADKEMEQLGTAAVHLVTIANSFVGNHAGGRG